MPDQEKKDVLDCLNSISVSFEKAVVSLEKILNRMEADVSHEKETKKK